jgi:hypothetical protein
MRKPVYLLMAAIVFLVACQKEISLENSNSGPNNPTNPDAGLLTRLVNVFGNDSTVATIAYDASNRLILHNYTAPDPADDTYLRVVRSSNGTITRYTRIDDEVLSLGLDSLVTNLFYNSALARYTHSISTFADGSEVYFDSTAFTYDGSGNMTAKTSYLRVGPSPYIEYQESEYTYAGGNATSEKYYTVDPQTGVMEQRLTYNYSYDDKVNPLKLGTESMILMDDASYFGNNNASSVDILPAATPGDSQVITVAYTYNAANKPAGATITQQPGSGTSTLRFYYN